MVSSLTISSASAAQQQAQQINNPFRQDQNDPTRSLREQQQAPQTQGQGQQQTSTQTTNAAASAVQTQKADTDNHNAAAQNNQFAATSAKSANEAITNTGQDRGSVLDITV